MSFEIIGQPSSARPMVFTRSNLYSDFAPDLVHGLLVSKLDLTLMDANPGPNRKLTTTKVNEAPLYVVLPENSCLITEDAVRLTDLADYNWILFDRKVHPHLHDAVLRRPAEEEIVVRSGLTVLMAEDAAQLVNEGLGMAFFSISEGL